MFMTNSYILQSQFLLFTSMLNLFSHSKVCSMFGYITTWDKRSIQ